MSIANLKDHVSIANLKDHMSIDKIREQLRLRRKPAEEQAPAHAQAVTHVLR